MNCEDCKAQRAGEAPVSYIAHEAALARAERTEKRLIAVIIILILLAGGLFFGWMYDRSQYEVVEETSYEVEQDADNGTNNFAGGDMLGNAENQGN